MEWAGISWWQWLGLVSGLVYIITAARELQHSWAYGIISSICICVEDFLVTHLFMDGVLHMLYAFMGVLGLFLWRQKSSSSKVMKITRMTWQSFLGYLVLSGFIGCGAGYLLDTQSDACYPYLDSFISTLAVFSTFLVIYRVLDVWWNWLLINVCSIYLYLMTGAPCFALLYIGYLISNGLKWYHWMGEWKLRSASIPLAHRDIST
ncbi:MAG: nicotinamide riboside transporter PnuC [Bacteroidota bacterium]